MLNRYTLLQAANYGEFKTVNGTTSVTTDNGTGTVGNEESVGKALRETHVPRSDIFLTTKLE